MEEVHDIEWAMLRVQEIIDMAGSEAVSRKGNEIWKVLRQAHMDMLAGAKCNMTCRHFLGNAMNEEPCRSCLIHDVPVNWEWRGAGD